MCEIHWIQDYNCSLIQVWNLKCKSLQHTKWPYVWLEPIWNVCKKLRTHVIWSAHNLRNKKKVNKEFFLHWTNHQIQTTKCVPWIYKWEVYYFRNKNCSPKKQGHLSQASWPTQSPLQELNMANGKHLYKYNFTLALGIQPGYQVIWIRAITILI